ncbi:restriction endonuclease [Micromonospora sp. WMMD1155]|uniref:restriction endonuclease n=1 Tax=Micromonospora sp. WMMD1155 TaxID=3016094 RepID=UPI00249C23C3|nr:restriction endonuclease [Micromonospora sp. WMMD1155]WFE48875.1 restriction endonuclease [Micromonospora sp. WMMD1155]
MPLIELGSPSTWKELEQLVGQILSECGFAVELQREITLVRGAATVDAYAVDRSTTPSSSVIVECKTWDVAIPQHVVHSFRTVVSDSGANRGILVSLKGFQSGAILAAEKSNISLLSWMEFQELFSERWIHNYMVPLLRREIDPLVEYTEPINSRIFRKADALSANKQKEFRLRREQYRLLAWKLPWFIIPPDFPIAGPDLTLPLRRILPTGAQDGYPDFILDEMALRPLAEHLANFWRDIIATFDSIFGGRA